MPDGLGAESKALYPIKYNMISWIRAKKDEVVVEEEMSNKWR